MTSAQHTSLPSVVRPRVMLAVTLLVVAANLRPTLTALGPVIDQVGADTGLGPAALGLVGALPLVAFAVVSPLVHLLSRRWGADRTVFAATLVLIAGTLVRSLPGPTANLWLGTAVIGASIAVCNVLVPSLVKRDFPREVPLMTGAYSAVLSGAAALASGLALPVSRLGGWRLGVGIWGLLSVVAALVWVVRLRQAEPSSSRRGPVTRAGPSVWSSGMAWLVTGFMATQATTFYLLVTWLPSIEVSQGVSPDRAGWELFLYQAAGIAAGLGISFPMRGRRDHRAVAAAVSLTVVVGVAGLLLAPNLRVAWLLLAGLGGGASLVIALALVGERTRDAVDAGRLSGMVQSVGYLLAVAGPVGAGALFQLTGAWTSTLLALVGVGLVQCVIALFAGRDRYIDARTSAPTARAAGSR